MKPTEILSNEHRIIEVVIDCLEAVSEQAVREQQLDGEAAEQTIDIIRTFADRCHHGKEEGQLFPALAAKGMPSEGGPVGQMLLEHELGRTFVRKMTETIPEATAGNRSALQQFADSAQGYIQLLRAHIKKEDAVLFPIADRLLDEEAQKSILAAFESVETNDMGDGTHEEYLRSIEALADKLGVSKKGLSGRSCGCTH